MIAVLKDFRYNIILRVLLLIGVVTALVSCVFVEAYSWTVVFSLILGIMVWRLIHYVYQTNRDLAYFFSSVKYNDFTANISSTRKGAAFEDLHDGFNLINRKFQDIRAEKEANHQFLQAIIKQVDVGLLCIDQNEQVILMNEALQHLLHKSYLINLEGLKKIDVKLWETCKKQPSGQRELVKVNIQNKLHQLAVRSAAIALQEKHYRIYAFQDIQSELANQEYLAWQKLIRILTHEIMNSVAPISSLSGTMKSLLDHETAISETQLAQLKRSLSVIERRSEGLLKFTETYRALTRIPPPKFTKVNVMQLINDVALLFEEKIQKAQIHFESSVQPKNLTIDADENLLQQVIINLMKNAIDAVIDRENPTIKIQAFKTANQHACLQLADNGVGIPEKKLDQIFVPFFTTKPEGSGIGLSLSRQIMHLHQGNIELQSKENEGTTVSLSL